MRYCTSTSPPQPEGTAYLCEQEDGHMGPHTRLVTRGGARSLTWGAFEFVPAEETEAGENTAQADAEAAWEHYKAEYVRQRHWLTPKRAGRQMRKREFIAGYMAALPEWNG